ncbi:hypothetical protein ATCC90586_008134 [Pythium insidiosum]|nr:hypothetical protein ATCC90586_008134 [Pythium insidiosum]
MSVGRSGSCSTKTKQDPRSLVQLPVVSHLEFMSMPDPDDPTVWFKKQMRVSENMGEAITGQRVSFPFRREGRAPITRTEWVIVPLLRAFLHRWNAGDVVDEAGRRSLSPAPLEELLPQYRVKTLDVSSRLVEETGAIRRVEQFIKDSAHEIKRDVSDAARKELMELLHS